MPRVPRELNARLGQRLRQCRQAAGMTQAKLGQLLGVSFQMVQKYESGQNHLSVVQFQKITQIFQRDLVWFLQAEENT